jgi:hypothetical protein
MIFSLALTIDGCSSKLIFVPSGCNISNVNYPILDLVDRNTTLGEAKRCATNYTLYKEAFEKQRKIIEVCR